ncbi:Alpha/Beta hydrolase protein [Thelonectria olida]|uniref:Alpha/Beta hydrolase protein n=1 Tax=Thelonectria olida TaxID=1576542 RepID=A0A9P8W8E3_9HYPO|nr:Alpha/Beta hydrolase protein [Thelonectria olida]
MAQLVSQGDIADNAHGVTDILALDPKKTLENADNYELFATHADADHECEPINPGRSNWGKDDPQYRAPSPGEPDGPSDHDSPDHGPSKIPWAPCSWANLPAVGDSTDCATLNVPLDYTSPGSNSSIDLQLLRLKATNTPVKGSILFNPGGPGNTAVDWIANRGSTLLKILGGHFNIIGFDPRLRLPQFNSWPELQRHWDGYGKFADSCFKHLNDRGRFIGTAFTARDMLAIVDALEEDGKLWYWGISYGTVLGQVFAAMFPDRVGRLLLDANLLAEDYLVSGASGSPRDAEKSLNHLLSECFKAGPKSCALAGYSKTAQDVRRDLENLFTELINADKVSPEWHLNPGEFPRGGVSVLGKLKDLIFKRLYVHWKWEDAADILLSALEGNWRQALRLNDDDDDTASALSGKLWNRDEDSFHGIACSDSYLRAEAPEDVYSLLQAHMAQSSFADAIAPNRLLCSRWKLDAAEKVNTSLLRNVNTSFPILFANGEYDPVTPLSHAWEASARFRGSRVLVHTGVGHGVTGHTSDCTNQAIREYFEDGKLPDVDTVCEPNRPVFEPQDQNQLQYNLKWAGEFI